MTPSSFVQRERQSFERDRLLGGGDTQPGARLHAGHRPLRNLHVGGPPDAAQHEMPLFERAEQRTVFADDGVSTAGILSAGEGEVRVVIEEAP